MNLSDLTKEVTERSGLSRNDAERTVRAVLDIITSTLATGDTINLVGFGSFSLTERPERQGRHPQTGAEITIAASRAVKFKPGKGLKDRLNAS